MSKLGLALALLVATQSFPAFASAPERVAPQESQRVRPPRAVRVVMGAAKTTAALIGAYVLTATAPFISASVGEKISPLPAQTTVSAEGQPAGGGWVAGSLVWKTTTGRSLFGKDGPKATDVEQGALRDCTWISAFSAEAKANPDLIKNAITRTADGKYLVILHPLKDPVQEVTVTANGKLVPEGAVVPAAHPTIQHVVIDGAIALYPQAYQLYYAAFGPQYKLAQPAYARSKDPSIVWGPLLEKGVANALVDQSGQKTGYPGMDTGDLGARTLSILSGKVSSQIYLPEAPAQGTWIAMNNAVANHQAMVAGTVREPSFRLTLHGLIANHGYSVLGTETIHGKPYVVLRNPHGFRISIMGVHVGNGVFALSFDRFMSSFENLGIN